MPPLTRTERARSFRDLTVWQEANALNTVTAAVAVQFPPGYAFLADQLRRASASIALNIAEGNGKPTRREYLRFLGIARGSLNEVDACVELGRACTLAAVADLDAMALGVRRIGRLLAALVRALSEPPASAPVRDVAPGGTSLRAGRPVARDDAPGGT